VSTDAHQLEALLASILPKQRFSIPERKHIHTNGGREIDIEKFRALRQVAAEASKAADVGRNGLLLQNISKVLESDLEAIFQKYGGHGLYKLSFLASTCQEGEFDHFYGVVKSDLQFSHLPKAPLTLDNKQLRAGAKLDDFNHNVVDLSFGRKLFNPGKRPGYLVYGIGGPRILISLPFVGANRFFYNVFSNSWEVVTSLMLRGYFGTFLLLDSVDGLNGEVDDQPAWLLWFSIISCHCDLIIFVSEEGKELTSAQTREIEFTPNHVGKKLLKLKPGELNWSRKDGNPEDGGVMYLSPEGEILSAEQWNAETARYAAPYIERYRRGNLPADRLILTEERLILSDHELIDLAAGSSGPDPRPSKTWWWPFRRPLKSSL
jgi:hypothetical protein